MLQGNFCVPLGLKVRKIVRGNRNVNRSLSQNHSNIWKISDDREFNSYKYLVDTDHPIFRGLIDEKKIKEKDLKFFENSTLLESVEEKRT